MENFKILVNEQFMNFCSKKDLSPTENKHLLNFINDFEEGSWRFEKFQDFIWDNIALTALSHKEREKLVNKSFSTLRQSAKNLRLLPAEKTDFGRGSEIAEIILYAVMKYHYEALSVVPKIFYKQNSQDNAKGADSVHIVLENSGKFSLWFGEAKFYKNIEDTALDRVVTSVKASLNPEKIRKENSIIVNISDLDGLIKDQAILSNIKALLSSNTTLDKIKPILHIPILLLHECSITKNTSEMSEEYKNSIINYHKKRAEVYFSKQISKLKTIHMYEKITFHLILFPVPDKAKIVDTFIEKANDFRK